MPEIHPIVDALGNPMSPPDPRAAVFWDGTYWRIATVDGGGRLSVRGEDQLFSIEDTLWDGASGVISGAGGYIELAGPPAGEYWVVTNVGGYDTSSPTIYIALSNRRAGANQFFHYDVRAIPAGERSIWDGMIVMENGDVFRAYFGGALAGDAVAITVMGYKMTIEV